VTSSGHQSANFTKIYVSRPSRRIRRRRILLSPIFPRFCPIPTAWLTCRWTNNRPRLKREFSNLYPLITWAPTRSYCLDRSSPRWSQIPRLHPLFLMPLWQGGSPQQRDGAYQALVCRVGSENQKSVLFRTLLGLLDLNRPLPGSSSNPTEHWAAMIFGAQMYLACVDQLLMFGLFTDLRS